MTMIDYTYEVEKHEETGTETVWFNLNSFPGIKFNYVDVRFGSIDEENQVPVQFDLDYRYLKSHEEDETNRALIDTKEFEAQASALLVHLLSSIGKTLSPVPIEEGKIAENLEQFLENIEE